MLPVLGLTRHLVSEGGCTFRTGRHLLIIVVFMLTSISGTVSEPGEDTGTVSALSTDGVGLSLHSTGVKLGDSHAVGVAQRPAHASYVCICPRQQNTAEHMTQELSQGMYVGCGREFSFRKTEGPQTSAGVEGFGIWLDWLS